MHILRLLGLGKSTFSWDMLYVTFLAGLSNALLLALVNIAAEHTYLGNPVGADTFLLYLVAFAIYYVSNKASLNRSNNFLQSRLQSLRDRLAIKIQNADLRALEEIEHGRIYSVLTQELNHFSHHFTLLASAAQSSVLLIMCLVYIAFLSFSSFLVIGLATCLGLLYFWLRRLSLNEAMYSVNEKESKIFESLHHYTDGFQELRMHADRSNSLQKRFESLSAELEKLIASIGGKWVVLLLFSNAFLYILVGIVVFVLPFFFDAYTDTIYKLVTASIFIVGPVAAITSSAPIFFKANIGLGHVFELEKKLEAGRVFENYNESNSLKLKDFESIRLEDFLFRYETSGFESGPWSLRIRRGECIFLTGGNGSGKSTALKLICGLYSASNGSIFVDEQLICKELQPEYRSLFSVVFADFYLFDELYGISNVSRSRVQELISWMQLDHKVSFDGRKFSTQDLSSGQRKRLALIVSLLENREIILLDEWAADQDAFFRAYFYTDILPQLKKQGKTLIVISHDDKYWHMCDRRVHLDLGEMQVVDGCVASGEGGHD